LIAAFADATLISLLLPFSIITSRDIAAIRHYCRCRHIAVTLRHISPIIATLMIR